MTRPSEDSWTAIVINYNAGEHLAACVASLFEDDATRSVEVIVVDNASTDGSIEALEALEAPRRARVIKSPGNVGYARAANLGIAVSRDPYVAVLNPDVIVGAGTARAMVARLRDDPKLGAVGPRIFDSAGADYPSARQVPGFATALGHFILGFVAPDNRWSRRYRQVDLDPTEPRFADWLSGAAIWLRRDALDDVGGWDERYFLFLEDVDLCVRLREREWRVAFEPSGSVVHIEGVSRRQHPYRAIAEHHRAALRFADLHWNGSRRLLLPIVAAGLAMRAMALSAVAFAQLRMAE